MLIPLPVALAAPARQPYSGLSYIAKNLYFQPGGSRIAATWPLLPAIASALLLGTEHEATVPLFNLSTLSWDADRLPQGFLGLSSGSRTL